MKGISSLPLFLLPILLFSCKQSPKKDIGGKDSYKYYRLEEKGWKSKNYVQTVDGVSYTATEVPVSYYILKDIGKEKITSVDSIVEANKGERIIEFEFLQIEEKNLLEEKFTKMDYEKTVNYLSFEISKDFYLVTSSKDTIKSSGGAYERAFKLTPHQKVLLFFSGVPEDDNLQLVYSDKLFGKGTLKFKFNEKLTKPLL